MAKVASKIEAAPQVYPNENGFDVVVCNNCVHFRMEMCVPLSVKEKEYFKNMKKLSDKLYLDIGECMLKLH